MRQTDYCSIIIIIIIIIIVIIIISLLMFTAKLFVCFLQIGCYNF